jgi:4-hydroxyphenylpyruvate dioxygenase-like putative hemolysin
MSSHNPVGLSGFEYVDFTSRDAEAMGRQREQFGFADFRSDHGLSASAMAFRAQAAAKTWN